MLIVRSFWPLQAHGGFCPVVPEGYGFSYQIRDDILGSYVSSYGAGRAADMRACFKSAMIDLKRVIKGA